MTAPVSIKPSRPNRVLIVDGLPSNRTILYAMMSDFPLVSSLPGRGHRSSADLLFNPAAQTFGKNAVGIMSAGMGFDGFQGLQTQGRTGAHINCQDQESSTVFGMPKMAFELDAVDEILSPAGIVARLTKLYSQTQSFTNKGWSANKEVDHKHK